MILQRIGNRGLFLGAMFDDGLARNPYQRITLDHRLDVAPEMGTACSVYSIALLVADLAVALDDAGVRPGDTVAIHKQDNFDIFLLACAVSRARAVPMLLSPALPGEVVAKLLERVDWPQLITDEHTLTHRLPAIVRERSRRVLLASGEREGATPLRRRPECAPAPFVPPDPAAPALITHTSGTTDTPKLVLHTARTLRARYRLQAVALRGLVRGRETLAVHVSFVHSRLVTALAIAISRGFPLVIVRDPDVKRIGDLFCEHKPGIIEAHPNTFVAWEELADDPRGPLARVKYISSTFDAIHPRTVMRLLGASRRERPGQLQLYGQSEVGPVTGRVTSRRHTSTVDGRCVGFPIPGMTAVRVVARGGRRPSAATPGFIEVRSDGRALTYVNQDDRYQDQLRDGWWRMGDVGYRTRWGCVHISDREVDVIPGFGSALEMEDALMSRMPSLLEIIIIPGESGVATPVVVTRDGSPLDLAAWAAATRDLPAMQPPLQMSLAELPRTGTAKVQRLELIRRLQTIDG